MGESGCIFFVSLLKSFLAFALLVVGHCKHSRAWICFPAKNYIPTTQIPFRTCIMEIEQYLILKFIDRLY